jgi:hypothetical protein
MRQKSLRKEACGSTESVEDGMDEADTGDPHRGLTLEK